MRVLGIDLALGQTGWALVEHEMLVASGVLSTKRAGTKAQSAVDLRSTWLLDALRTLINEQQPDVIYVEDHARVNKMPGRSVRTIGALAQARTLLDLACDQTAVSLIALPVHVWRCHFTGKASASKSEVWRWLCHMRLEAGAEPRSGSPRWDEAEAKAIALVGGRLERIKELSPAEEARPQRRARRKTA